MSNETLIDQAVIGLVIVAVILIAGYLAKVALKFVVSAAIIIAVIYVGTTNPDDISTEHAVEWAKTKSQDYSSRAIDEIKELNSK